MFIINSSSSSGSGSSSSCRSSICLTLKSCNIVVIPDHNQQSKTSRNSFVFPTADVHCFSHGPGRFKKASSLKQLYWTPFVNFLYPRFDFLSLSAEALRTKEENKPKIQASCVTVGDFLYFTYLVMLVE